MDKLTYASMQNYFKRIGVLIYCVYMTHSIGDLFIAEASSRLLLSGALLAGDDPQLQSHSGL